MTVTLLTPQCFIPYSTSSLPKPFPRLSGTRNGISRRPPSTPINPTGAPLSSLAMTSLGTKFSAPGTYSLICSISRLDKKWCVALTDCSQIFRSCWSNAGCRSFTSAISVSSPHLIAFPTSACHTNAAASVSRLAYFSSSGSGSGARWVSSAQQDLVSLSSPSSWRASSPEICSSVCRTWSSSPQALETAASISARRRP